MTLPPIESYWYLATPYSRYPGGIKEAFIAACEIAAALILRGVPVFSPIAHSHPIAKHGAIDPRDHAIWLPADRPLMAAAGGLLVATIAGWDDSYGVQVEIQEFTQAGKPVLYLAWPECTTTEAIAR